MAFYGILIVKFGSEVRSPCFLGDLAGYIFFAITSSRVYRLCSFLNMMRISSSATNCVKGVYFCSAILEKLASKLPLILPLEAFDRTGSAGAVTLNFVTSGIHYTVLNSSSNVDSEYVYFI